ncbi:hypothetical protein ACFL0I_01825 [Gemmatimonadota bacterium]
MLFLKILGGIVALGIGLYLGGSGQYRQKPEEVEKALDGEGKTWKVKRHYTWLGWLRKDERASQRRLRGSPRKPFKFG